MQKEKVIKQHLPKPVLEKANFGGMEITSPTQTFNIVPKDIIDIRKVAEETVKVTVERQLIDTNSAVTLVSAVMGVMIPIDSIEFGKLEDPKEYIKQSLPVKVLLGNISNQISNLTIASVFGPIITGPTLFE